MNPKISVVIPTFNRGDVLRNAVESVLAQTYRDYELIVVDDGSTDDTQEVLRPYMDRIRYFHQENRGASAAQNKGIELGVGKWVSILASDDIWLPEKLEKQIEALSKLGPTVGACFTDCVYLGDPLLNQSAFEQAGLKPAMEFEVLANPIPYILGKYTPIWVQSMIVLRSLLTDMNGFDETMKTQEDTDLLFRLSFRTRFCCVAAPLVKIDATPSRPRLRDLDASRNDEAHARVEYRYKKWLSLPQTCENGICTTIREQLCELYYDWAITSLYGVKFLNAANKLREVKQLGESYPQIVMKLLSRASTKLLRSFAQNE